MVDLLQVHIIKKLVIMGVKMPPPTTANIPVGKPTCWPTKIDITYRADWSSPVMVVSKVLKYKFVDRDIENPIHVVFEKPLIGRLLRIVVKEYYGSECLRWDLYGCPIRTPAASQ